MQLKDLVKELELKENSLTEDELNILELALIIDNLDKSENLIESIENIEKLYLDNDTLLVEGVWLDKIKDTYASASQALSPVIANMKDTVNGKIDKSIGSLFKSSNAIAPLVLLIIAKIRGKNDTEIQTAAKKLEGGLEKALATPAVRSKFLDTLCLLDASPIGLHMDHQLHFADTVLRYFKINVLTKLADSLPQSPCGHGHSADKHEDGDQEKESGIINIIKNLKDKIASMLTPDKTEEAHAALDKVHAIALQPAQLALPAPTK